MPCLVPIVQGPRARFAHEPGVMVANGTKNPRVLQIRLRERNNYGVQRNNDLEEQAIRHIKTERSVRPAGHVPQEFCLHSRKQYMQQQPDHNPIRRQGSEASTVASSSSRRGSASSGSRPARQPRRAEHLIGCAVGVESDYVGSHQTPPTTELRDLDRMAGCLSTHVTKGPIDHEEVIPKMKSQPWTDSVQAQTTMTGVGPVAPGITHLERRHFDSTQTGSAGAKRALKTRRASEIVRGRRELKQNLELTTDKTNDIYFWTRPGDHRMLGANEGFGGSDSNYLSEMGTLESMNGKPRKRFTIGTLDGVALSSRLGPEGHMERSTRQEGVQKQDDDVDPAGKASDKHDMCYWWRKHDRDYTARDEHVDAASGLRKSLVRSFSADMRRGLSDAASAASARSPATSRCSAPLTARVGNEQDSVKDNRGNWQRNALFTFGPRGPAKDFVSEAKSGYTEFEYPESETIGSDAPSLPTSYGGSSLRTSRSASNLTHSARGGRAQTARLSQQQRPHVGSDRQRVAPGNECPGPPRMRRSASETMSARGERGARRPPARR